MKVLKRRFIDGTAILLIMISASVAAPELMAQEGGAKADETARTMYLQAYSMTTRANDYRDNREWSHAFTLYRAANDIYEKLMDQFPDWKADIVAKLNSEGRQQIAFVNEMLQRADQNDVPEDQSDDRPAPAPKTEESPQQAQRGGDLQRRTQIEKLEQDNRRLRRMVDRIKSQSEAAAAEYESQLRERIELLLNENEELRKELNAVGGDEGLLTDKSLNGRILDLTEENLRLNEQLTDSLETIRSLRAKEIGFTKLGRNYEKLLAENKELRDNQEQGYDKLMEERKELWRARFEDFQKESSAKIDDLRKVNAQLQDDLEELDAGLQKRDSTIDELRTTNVELAERIDELADAEKELSRRARKIRDLTEELDAMEVKAKQRLEKAELKWADKLEKYEADMRKKLERAAAENEDLKTLLEERNTAWKRERDRLVAVMDAKYEELEQERDQLASDLKETADAREKIERQAEEIGKLVEGVAELKKQHKSEIGRRNEMWANRVEQAEERARQDFEDVQTKLSAAQEKIVEMDGVWQGRQQELVTKWREKFENLSAKLDSREEELKESRSQLSELRALYDDSDIGKVVKDFARERELTAEKMATIQDAMTVLKRERDMASSEKFEVEGRLMELERRYRKLLDEAGD